MNEANAVSTFFSLSEFLLSVRMQRHAPPQPVLLSALSLPQ